MFLMSSLSFARPLPPASHQKTKAQLAKSTKRLQIVSDRMQQLLSKKPRRETRRKLRALASEVDKLSEDISAQILRLERRVRKHERAACDAKDSRTERALKQCTVDLDACAVDVEKREARQIRTQRGIKRCSMDLEACEADLSKMRRARRPAPARIQGPTKLSKKGFRTFLQTISNESFDRGRLSLLRDGLSQGVFFDARQALQIVKLFSFDGKRAEAAVLLCPVTLGKDAYLSFVSSIDHESNRQMFRTATGGGCGPK